MKSQISSVDLHYLIEEMQFLVGGRIDKIYHPKKEELLFQFHVTSKGKQILRILSGKFMFLSEYKGNYDLVATSNMDVKVGEIVVLEGKIALDKDFGFGYFYKVIMEDSKVIQ